MMSSTDLDPRVGRRALVLFDAATIEAAGTRVAHLERAGAVIKVVDHRRLMATVADLRKTLHAHDLDFVLFARNDQVFDRRSIGPLIRALRTGYSSFSGIDAGEALAQMRTCLDDYLAAPRRLALTAPAPAAAGPGQCAGTFSLIFDTEQLGGVRFGLPRVLDVLARHGARATFFLTNFVHAVYPDVLEPLVAAGHEVGLHGRYHEYLAGEPLGEQIASIGEMQADFGAETRIYGANFIGRMDNNTIRAMLANHLRYFVVFMLHDYRPCAYQQMPVQPLPIWSQDQAIWMVPVSVETYSRPWFTIRNMIDSALNAGRARGRPHVSILLHPFRDGTLARIGGLERLLGYLQGSLGLRAVPVCEVVDALPRARPGTCICYHYGFDEINGRSGTGAARKEWQSAAELERPTAGLYDALERRGAQPALCLDVLPGADVCAVHPRSSRALAEKLRGALPHYWRDYTGLVPEVALRLAYRMAPHRELF